MLLECFPNTSRMHMDATFGWSMKIILNMHNKFLELPNAVPYASVRSRTASAILDHTDCFPNMIRSLPEHPNSYSENKRNGIRASVIEPLRRNYAVSVISSIHHPISHYTPLIPTINDCSNLLSTTQHDQYGGRQD